jgi:hypothetical protein
MAARVKHRALHSCLNEQSTINSAIQHITYT